MQCYDEVEEMAVTTLKRLRALLAEAVKVLLALSAILVVAILIGLLTEWMRKSCQLPSAQKDIFLSCFEFWFNRYQTFIAALIAFAGAAASIFAIRYQTLSADRVARRNEIEAEKSLREIIRARAAIIAEAWKGFDWALSSDITAEQKSKRARAIFAVYWHSEEDRIELSHMRALARMVKPSVQIKIDRLLATWEAMLDHLDTCPEERLEGSDFVEWMTMLRIKFAFISMNLTRYDQSFSDLFAGLGHPHVNPGETAKRKAAVRGVLMRNVE